jgi:hypothetical protein
MTRSTFSALVRHRRQRPRIELVEERVLLSPFVVSNTHDSGAGSFRQAIMDANGHAGPDDIRFAITPAASSYTIALQTSLPGITDPVDVDGTSQSGYAGTPIIEIDGGGHAGDGLLLGPGSDGSTIKGLAIANFPAGAGIHVQSNRDVIESNFLGTNLAGTGPGPGNQTGLLIDGGTGNTIGGVNPGELNLISANQGFGMSLSFASNSTIQGNDVGTDITGMAALGNGNDGITDFFGQANTIGGSSAGAGNLVSANQGNGISTIVTTGDLVAENIVGASSGVITDPSAKFRRLGNMYDGILVSSGSTGNTVGGSTPGAGNLVVASGNNGIELSAGSDGNSVLGNAVGTTLATGSSIGIGPPVDLGNSNDGIFLASSSANTIGGANQLDSSGQFAVRGGNVASGNKAAGIFVSGNDTAQGNLLLGNLVGTLADGGGVLANGQNGILLGNSTANTIGGLNSLNPDGTLSSLSGNLISGNAFAGIELNGSSTTGNLVIGNRIGTDLRGANPRPNGLDGVLVDMGASNNTIGAASTDGAAANLISGNAQSGILIRDAGTTSNIVLGNRIGLAASGTATLPNLGDGVLLNASGNIVGGTTQGAGNIISGNLGSGVHITNSLPPFDRTSADDNQILGNWIGVDVTGVSSGVGNAQSGVEIDDASGTTIGGVASAAGTGPGNVISGNLQAGIHLTGASTATLIEGNIVGLNSNGSASRGNLLPGILLDGVSGNSVGANLAGAGNVVSNNGTAGLAFEHGASGNTAQGNLIGIDPAGTIALSPIQNGIEILDSLNNTIGGTDDFARNVISGNGLSGISISGSAASGNRVVGNRIGTDRSGLLPLANGLDGVTIDSAVTNTIGGTAPGSRNLISANRANGVDIRGSSSRNVVVGNFIGTTGSGVSALGNSQDGVFLTAGATSNVIGGTDPADQNLISANQSNGVELFAGATANTVEGNRIGTDGAGMVALGNGDAGVLINNASNNVIGGPTGTPGQGAGNLISGNRSSGVLLSGVGAQSNQIEGNLIGTDVTGSRRLSNSSTGVTIDSAENNTIGGTATGSGNVIAGNQTFGILVLGSSAVGNMVAGNLIGTNSTRASSIGNILDGVVINAAPGNTIGGSVLAARNVISGNGGNGINILNVRGQDGIAILGNFIGTDLTGTRAVGNGLDGVLLNAVTGTQIAGVAGPNLISGNSGNGVHLLGAGMTVVQDCMIGTDISGSRSVGNAGDGIAIEDAPASTIGGPAAGQGNLISGNAGNGIRVFGSSARGTQIIGDTIGTDLSGTSTLPNGGYGISIESTSSNLVQGDLISGNASGGVQITGFGASGNAIYGSQIGTDRAGASALSNGLAALNNGVGVFVNGAAGNRIGGDRTDQGNLISGNATAGVYIFGRFASGNTVQGNRIGTNSTGLRPILQDGSTLIQQVGVLVNQAPGLDIQGINPGPGNSIGGVTAGAGNVISGNLAGLEFSGTESQGNLVEGNLIGPASDGSGGAGNVIGVYINGAPRNVIGGALGNVISGNRSVGIYVLGSPSTGNSITGNIIGLKPGGLQRLPNQNGIYIENAPGNIIGGTSAATRNVISANSIAGVYILGGQSVGNLVEGNFIGYAANGSTRIGNAQYGVLLYNAPANTVVRSGPNANRTTRSGIANFREFTGRPVAANPSGGQQNTQSKRSHRSLKSPATRSRALLGRPVPRGPLRTRPLSRHSGAAHGPDD